MADSPLAPLSILMKRAAEAAQAEGLNVQAFLVTPNWDPDGPHNVQIVFRPIPDWNKDEPKVEDPEFEAFIEAQRKHEAEEKANQAREQLQGLADDLKDPNKGLGFD